MFNKRTFKWFVFVEIHLLFYLFYRAKNLDKMNFYLLTYCQIPV